MSRPCDACLLSPQLKPRYWQEAPGLSPPCMHLACTTQLVQLCERPLSLLDASHHHPAHDPLQLAVAVTF